MQVSCACFKYFASESIHYFDIEYEKKEFHEVLDYLVVSQKRIKPQYVLLGTPPASFRMSEMVAPHKRHALILMGPENGTSLGEKVPENLINS